MIRSCLVALALLLASSSVMAQDAPVFRGNLSSPILLGTDVPAGGGTVQKSLTLGTQVLPVARVGTAWEFDFSTLAEKSQGLTGIQWSTGATGLQQVPPGLTLNQASGVMSGIPLSAAEYSFQVAVDADDVPPAPATFTIVVDGIYLVATKVAVGNGHNCAIVQGGKLYCWGANASGQLGDGTQNNRPRPQLVNVPGVIKDVILSSSHTCALNTLNRAYCWGNNAQGQLGIGSTANQLTPQLLPLTDIKQIAGNTYVGCILTSAGGVQCWGTAGTYGMLGNDTTAMSLTPVTPTGLGSGVASISVNMFHACAVMDTGALKCWGLNNNRQLGVATGTVSGIVLSRTPVQSIASGIAQVQAGGSHTCVLSTAGIMSCIGGNDFGQANAANASTSVTSWTQVPGGTGVTSFASGGSTNCMLKSGSLSCWGRNDFGQAGRGNTGSAFAPAIVMAGVAQVASNENINSCAVMTDGLVQCWGMSSAGSLGSDGGNALSPRPVMKF